MLHEKYNDPISVRADFNGRIVTPRFFDWGRNRYSIERVLNVHSAHDGRERVYFFSVANQDDFFKIELHTEKLEWYLVEHYQE